MWNSGSTHRTTSSAVMPGGSDKAPSCSRLAFNARWVSIAALGRPDVPDVNMSTASDSGSVGSVGKGELPTVNRRQSSVPV